MVNPWRKTTICGGLSQRFLLSFGYSGPIPAFELERFVPDFALPFLSKVFAWVFQTMGPQVPINSSVPTWRTAPHQHHILDAARRVASVSLPIIPFDSSVRVELIL